MSRNTNDLQDSWSSLASIIELYGEDKGNFSSVAGPGFWNDPDEVNTILPINKLHVIRNSTFREASALIIYTGWDV